MSATPGLAEAIAAWRALPKEQRSHAHEALFPNFSESTPEEADACLIAHRLLEAAAEPEAKPAPLDWSAATSKCCGRTQAQIVRDGHAPNCISFGAP